MIGVKKCQNSNEFKSLEDSDFYVHYLDVPNNIRRTYIDGRFAPIQRATKPALYLSGVIDLNQTNFYFEDDDGDKIPDNYEVRGENLVGINNGPDIEMNELYKYVVSEAYKYSLYPTQNDVLQILEKHNPDQKTTEEEKINAFYAFEKDVTATFTPLKI